MSRSLCLKNPEIHFSSFKMIKHLYTAFVLISLSVCMVICADNDNFYRPCNAPITMDCVQEFFKDHIDPSCQMVTSTDDSSGLGNLKDNQNLPFFVPKIDTTVIKTKYYTPSFDGEFEEFYVDTSTSRLVMAVNFKQIQRVCPEALYVFGQKEVEPLVIADKFNITYSDIIITSVLQLIDGKITALSVSTGHYSTYVLSTAENSYAEFGPNILNSQEPRVLSALQGFAMNKLAVIQQIFNTGSFMYATEFIQSKIFNCNVPVGERFSYDSTVVQSVLDNGIDESEYDYPCKESSDSMTECVSAYVIKHSDSGDVSPPINNESVFRERLSTHVPWLNCTATPINAEITGLNDGKIEKFFINKKTKNWVLTVAFDNIHMTSESVPLVLNQRGREPKVYLDSNSDDYPVTFTAVWHVEDKITRAVLERVQVYEDFKGTPTFKTGNEYNKEQDDQVAEVITGLGAYPLDVGKDLFVTESYSLFTGYMQNRIANYGISMSDTPTSFYLY